MHNKSKTMARVALTGSLASTSVHWSLLRTFALLSRARLAQRLKLQTIGTTLLLTNPSLPVDTLGLLFAFVFLLAGGLRRVLPMLRGLVGSGLDGSANHGVLGLSRGELSSATRELHGTGCPRRQSGLDGLHGLPWRMPSGRWCSMKTDTLAPNVADAIGASR